VERKSAGVRRRQPRYEHRARHEEKGEQEGVEGKGRPAEKLRERPGIELQTPAYPDILISSQVSEHMLCFSYGRIRWQKA
jgi:hypothetical protein